MNAAKNLLLALIVTLTGMTAGAQSLLGQVSKTRSQESTEGIKGQGGTCE